MRDPNPLKTAKTRSPLRTKLNSARMRRPAASAIAGPCPKPFRVAATKSSSAVEVATPGQIDDSFLGLVSTANRSGHAATVLASGTLLVTGGDGLNSAETYSGLGLACKYPTDCGTGFCVDGYCCESACGGGAVAPVAPLSEGRGGGIGRVSLPGGSSLPLPP